MEREGGRPGKRWVKGEQGGGGGERREGHGKRGRNRRVPNNRKSEKNPKMPHGSYPTDWQALGLLRAVNRTKVLRDCGDPNYDGAWIYIRRNCTVVFK